MACPDEEQIRAYALGTLASRDRWVKGHVTGCSTCAGKLLKVAVAMPQAAAHAGVPLATATAAPPPRTGAAPRLEKMMAKSDSLPRGAAVGRYIIQGELGEGGMGKVYAALDPELDRKVALKLLHVGAEGSSSGSGGEARLLREAQAMARLSHPNVVGVHDVGRHHGSVFVAMELVEGTNLRQWLLDGPRPWREVLEVFLAAGLGLAAAHGKGLLHRDFKPPNVLIGVDRRVRVGDFGIARAVETQADPVRDKSDSTSVADDAVTQGGMLQTPLTKTGSVVGTFGYVAPEVMLGWAIDARADQFSFSVSLYEALYGGRPYAGRSYGDYYAALMKGPPAAAPKGPDVPSWMFKVVRKGISVKADERYASMADLLSAMQPPKGILSNFFKR